MKNSIKIPPLKKDDFKPYKVVSNFKGENWLIATGQEENGKSYYITTNHIHASELGDFSHGAKDDAKLMCYVLNLLANGKLKF